MNNLELDEILTNFQTEPQINIDCLVYCSSTGYNAQTVVYTFDSPKEAMEFARKHNELTWTDLLKENEI